jgi:hypothetical protein
MKAQRKILLPLVLVFIICNGFFIVGEKLVTKYGIDDSVLIVANILFLLLTLITFFIQQRALQNANPHVFVRSVMAGMMIKMFACMIAIFVYWFLMKEKFSKATVIVAMFMYLIYLVAEVILVTKLNRKKNA